ncbi:hypothetical protein BDA99DRAFT_604424 [Phascolomyces articulosus]|uniref:Uncharacterized protein n=1 Tax=Phascolomyces articulosus TaxID=60185 RepID=A0AAD5K207_9FUNG|nr:hypothetical protein BDA99DRAFT_604424 [Phascolomyces articulosus]
MKKQREHEQEISALRIRRMITQLHRNITVLQKQQQNSENKMIHDLPPPTTLQEPSPQLYNIQKFLEKNVIEEEEEQGLEETPLPWDIRSLAPVTNHIPPVPSPTTSSTSTQKPIYRENNIDINIRNNFGTFVARSNTYVYNNDNTAIITKTNNNNKENNNCATLTTNLIPAVTCTIVGGTEEPVLDTHKNALVLSFQVIADRIDPPSIMIQTPPRSLKVRCLDESFELFFSLRSSNYYNGNVASF